MSNANKRRGRPTGSLWDRLYTKIESSGDCWLFTGSLNNAGYGQIGKGSRSEGLVLAHRASYELMVSDIPEGLDLDHLCRNRACVNPYHLEPVTAAENNRRKVVQLKTHCKNGHPIEERHRRNGCPKCATERQRQRRQAQRQPV